MKNFLKPLIVVVAALFFGYTFSDQLHQESAAQYAKKAHLILKCDNGKSVLEFQYESDTVPTCTDPRLCPPQYLVEGKDNIFELENIEDGNVNTLGIVGITLENCDCK